MFKNAKEFCYEYEQPLAAALHEIERRGVLIDSIKLRALRLEIKDEIRCELDKIATAANCKVVLSKDKVIDDQTLILQSQPQLISFLEKRGLKIPKSRTTGKATTSADALHVLLAETGDPILHSILQIRELGKVLNTNVEAELHNDTLYFSFRATGTETGRRSSSECFVGIGCNGQNIPKWSKWGKKYRSCIVARPGKIFVQVDQKTAEDWIINGLIADISGIETGVTELRSGINRHKKLAGFIFGLPEYQINKESIQYYLAKRTRYAGAYGMGHNRMAEALASEGKIVTLSECRILLDKFHLAEPSIQGVFQRWIKSEILTKHCLQTPLGRKRDFLDLRPYSDNHETIRKGYAFIPQSTVGDNTGMAIIYLEFGCRSNSWRQIVSESHDSILLEVSDTNDCIEKIGYQLTESFNRILTFPLNHYQVQIPIEFEIGYSLGDLTTCDFAKPDGWKLIVNELRSLQKPTQSSIFGAGLHS